MATNKSKPTVERKPVQLPEEAVVAPTPPAPRIHLKEFLHHANLQNPVQRAGFTAFLGGKVWMRLEEWEKALKSYLNRDQDNNTDKGV